MFKLYSPKAIPIHFFYFGWRKALSHIKTENCVYDPIEVEKFNYDLRQRLLNLQEEFANGNYVPDPTITYLVPKSAKFDEKTQAYIPRVRPMVQFSFRDQVAWATIMLVLAEWFDTSDEMLKLIPIQKHEQREIYRWMVPWSLNNRIKRIHQINDYNNLMERQFVHYNHKQMYESFQWSLRNWRETQKQQFQLIREKHGKAYYGEMDIKEFYPTLKIGVVLRSLRARFEQLKQAEVVDDDSHTAWLNLLEKMRCFEIDFHDTFLNRLERDFYHKKSMEKLVESILGQQQGTLKEDLIGLAQFLKDSLPIGLIASGFFANCALTQFFDLPMEEHFRDDADRIYINRYTDDIKIIGSNPKIVLNAMFKANELLADIGLALSRDKMNPSINFEPTKELSKRVTIPPFVGEFDPIPGSTAIIEKLSQIGDRKVWTLNHDELEQFIGEMLSLVDTRFDSQDIQDETKTTFVAWRLRIGAKEALIRNIAVPIDNIKESLRNALARYPHKTSLIDFYVMHLFDISPHWDIVSEIDVFMKWFQEKHNDVIDSTIDLLCHPMLRTRLMLAIGNYWFILPYNKRKKVAGIILDNIRNWYRHPPNWHEKAAIYWLLAVIDAGRDMRVIDEQCLIQENSIVRNIYDFYRFLGSQGELFHDGGQIAQTKIYFLRVAFTVFWLRKTEADRISYQHLPEERRWTRSFWGKLKKSLEENFDTVDLQLTWLLAKYCKEEVPVFGFETLLQITLDDFVGDDYDRSKLFHDILHYFDSILHEWIDFPEREHIQCFLKALAVPVDATSSVKEYVCKRLRNLAAIKLHMCKVKSGIDKLPDNILPGANELRSVKPTLLDWLAVCSSKIGAQKNINRQAKIQALTEYQVLRIMSEVGTKAKKNNSRVDLRSFVIPLDLWTQWRSELLEGLDGNIGNNDFMGILPEGDDLEDLNGNIGNKDGTVVRKVTENFNPDRFYIDNVDLYLRELQSAQGSYGFDDFHTCLDYALMLAMLLSGARINASVFDLPRIMQWRRTQYVINKCNAPSSGIVHLITDTVNYLFQFYKHRYESLGYLKLPYRPYLSKDVVTVPYFQRVIYKLLEEKKKQYRSCSHGVLELRFIDLDVMVEGE